MHQDSVDYLNDAVGSFWAQLVNWAEIEAILGAMILGLMSQRGK